MISHDQIQHVIDIIAKTAHPERIVMFGSYATGTPTPDSDLDLVVIQETPLPPAKRTQAIRKALRGTTVPIDLIVYTPQEVSYWAEEPLAFPTKIANQGKTVWAKSV
jgi:predicted nucleotidyltransferase